MPRGSLIGERRGGRKRGTPNRRTILVERILAIASERPTIPAEELVAILSKDRELPADVRIRIARKFLPNRTSRAVGSNSARYSADNRRNADPAGSRSGSPGPAKPVNLDILFSLVQDTAVPTDHRREAASLLAQCFLPMKPGIKRWWLGAHDDEYGFAITAEIAAEYRDAKFEFRRLSRSGSNGPRTRNKIEKLRARIKTILHRLQCPCPSLYGKDQLSADSKTGRLFFAAAGEQDPQRSRRCRRGTPQSKA